MLTGNEIRSLVDLSYEDFVATALDEVIEACKDKNILTDLLELDFSADIKNGISLAISRNRDNKINNILT